MRIYFGHDWLQPEQQTAFVPVQVRHRAEGIAAWRSDSSQKSASSAKSESETGYRVTTGNFVTLAASAETNVKLKKKELHLLFFLALCGSWPN